MCLYIVYIHMYTFSSQFYFLLQEDTHIITSVGGYECIYMHICVCIYMCLYIYKHTCIYVHIQLITRSLFTCNRRTPTSLPRSASTDVSICIYVSIYSCVYKSMYIHIQTCVYIYLCTSYNVLLFYMSTGGHPHHYLRRRVRLPLAHDRRRDERPIR